MRPTFSVITVTLNSARTIASTVLSVRNQKNVSVEHVIKDAQSSDDTIAIAKRHNHNVKIVSCADKGIYDAMNQGFLSSSGKFIAFLNSDDFYTRDDVLCEIADKFEKHSCDFVYGDILIVNDAGIVVRNWRSGELLESRLTSSQLPHPAFVVRRSRLAQINGPFDTSYKISADLKQQLYLINIHRMRGVYLAKPIVVMALGGASTASFASHLRGWTESRRAWNEVHGHGGAIYVARKVLSKLKQLRFWL